MVDTTSTATDNTSQDLLQHANHWRSFNIYNFAPDQ
jgi:hypothetical protein